MNRNTKTEGADRAQAGQGAVVGAGPRAELHSESSSIAGGGPHLQFVDSIISMRREKGECDKMGGCLHGSHSRPSNVFHSHPAMA